MPRISYIVCATPRSGSALLCEALGRTGLAGTPREYVREWSTDDEATLTRAGRLPADAYMRRIFEESSTPNGVFGIKIMRGYLDVVVDNLRPFAGRPNDPAPDVLASVFPNLHYVHISRHDKVRQAVSLAKALQSEQWHDVVEDSQSNAGDGALHRKHRPKKQPVYDFDQIARHHRALLDEEAAWQTYFTAAGVEPHRVLYEELAVSHEHAGPAVLDYLQIPRPDTIAAWQPVVRRQSDALNEEWTQRFTEDLSRQTSPGLLKTIASYFTSRQ